MDQPIFIEKSGRVCSISLNRPKLSNCLDLGMLSGLATAFRTLNEDEEVRVVVLRGAGDAGFCAGLNLQLVADHAKTPGDRAGAEPFLEVLEAIETYRFPVIAMIRGFAIGAGCEIAAACDLRVASEQAKLAMPPARLGLVYSLGGHRRFVELLGVANAKELFLTAAQFGAPRAKEMGLVNRVVPEDRLQEETYALAATIADNAPLGLAGAKAMINRCAGTQAPSQQEKAALNQLMWESMRSQDAEEAHNAFREKRKPQFVGR